MNIEFEECVLEINGNQMVFEHPISSASTDGDLIFLIFDYSDFPIDRQANNLECIDQAGNFLWCAVSPINSPAGAFTNFVEVEKNLVVGNFAGYDAVIDKKTGEVVDTKFTR